MVYLTAVTNLACSRYFFLLCILPSLAVINHVMFNSISSLCFASLNEFDYFRTKYCDCVTILQCKKCYLLGEERHCYVKRIFI